jgi:hypothetical protein
MRDCNTEFDETSVDKSNTPESDTTINNTSGVNNDEDKSVIGFCEFWQSIFTQMATIAIVRS